MRAFTTVASAAVVAVVLFAGLAGQAQEAAPAGGTMVATAQNTPDPEDLLGDPYVLTWEKDPRARGRDPFESVLRFVGTETRRASTFDLPRTPAEESAFAMKAASTLEEANAALDDGELKLADERLDTVSRMVEVPLVTDSAKEKLAAVRAELPQAQVRLSSMRARAALRQALELAGRMQAYFDHHRFSEVVDLHGEVLSLDNDSQLRNPEVAGTARPLLAMCSELARRAQVHIEFAQMELAIDAVSYFPHGRSFAIVNGEVIGEGGSVAPELGVASVAGSKVVFSYKGERIALELEN